MSEGEIFNHIPCKKCGEEPIFYSLNLDEGKTISFCERCLKEKDD